MDLFGSNDLDLLDNSNDEYRILLAPFSEMVAISIVELDRIYIVHIYK
jgi:hypothetical protein